MKRTFLAIPSLLLILPVMLPMKSHNPEPVDMRSVPASETAFPPADLPDSLQTVEIDLQRSTVEWRGTKLTGGGHEGIVKFQEGKLLMSGDKITGGRFVVDMTSIEVTDIPKSQPTPRRNLTDHLMSDFATRIFPTAEFIFTEVSETESDTWKITGELSIRGVTRPVTITAARDRRRNLYTSEFTFDRFDWGIGEDGTWLERRLVNAEVQIRVGIHIRQEWD